MEDGVEADVAGVKNRVTLYNSLSRTMRNNMIVLMYVGVACCNP